MNIKAMLYLELFDKNGKLVKKRKMKANSFVGNFLNNTMAYYWGQNMDPIVNTYKREDGTFITRYTIASPATMQPANTLYGIELGTGNNPVTVLDFGLQNKILNGVGAGQLQISLNHNINLGTCLSYNGSNQSKFTFGRNFTNNSGNTISVTESGIIAMVDILPGNSQRVCIERTVFAAFNILNTQAVTVTYEVTITI